MLPQILIDVKNILIDKKPTLCDDHNDGRINSCMDEKVIIEILSQEIPENVKFPCERMWYDILLKHNDTWIPVNIKSTTTKTCDNTANLAVCVYSYTNYAMDLNKKYNNGIMSKVLIKKLREKEYNISERDYYFIVVNKENNNVIINSCLGLKKLTPNINNLPFQIKWCDNSEYIEKSMEENVKMFIECIKKPQPSWKEKFLSDMRNLSL